MKQFIIAVAFVTLTCTIGLGQESGEGEQGRITSEEYAQAEAALRKEQEAGRLTDAEVRERLGEINRRVGVRDAEEVERSRRDFRAALQDLIALGKLRDEQANELYEIVFPESDAEWDAKYLTYLNENPGVAKAVESGKISKEKVIAGLKSRDEERAPTEEEQLEALYQQMLKEHPELGRTTKEELMPRLKFMIAEGQGKNQRPDKSTEARVRTFGSYLSNLIHGLRQFEIGDKDLQKVYEKGMLEIRRQAADSAEPKQ